MLGSSIEYYDIALYGYMAPVLVEVFLPQLSKLSAYFYYFLFEFFASLCQVMGARFYGKMGDIRGRKKAMYYSMLGTSVITFTISILPTYQHIGLMATLLFASCRLLQSFFLGGEYNGGAIYCFEHEPNCRKYGVISGLYCALTVAGIIAASIIATLIHILGPQYFRLAYAISFLLAIFTYSIRKRIKETPEYLKIRNNFADKECANFWYRFVSIVIASLFFGMLYGLPTRIFNALLPLATNINMTQIMLINTSLLFLYMLLLVAFGILADQIGIQKVMSGAALTTVFMAYPALTLVETKAVWAIILAKAIFATLTAAFMAPFHAWTQGLFTTKIRYRSISTAYAVGKCCSTLLLACTILIFEYYHSITNIAVVLIIIAIITWRIFYEKRA